MRKIASKDMKVGNFIRTSPSFDSLDKKGVIYNRFKVFKIKKISKGKDGKEDIKYNGWWVIPEKNISKTAVLSNNDLNDLYLLEGKELEDFKRNLILHNLK